MPEGRRTRTSHPAAVRARTLADAAVRNPHAFADGEPRSHRSPRKRSSALSDDWRISRRDVISRQPTVRRRPAPDGPLATTVIRGSFELPLAPAPMLSRRDLLRLLAAVPLLRLPAWRLGAPPAAPSARPFPLGQVTPRRRRMGRRARRQPPLSPLARPGPPALQLPHHRGPSDERHTLRRLGGPGQRAPRPLRRPLPLRLRPHGVAHRRAGRGRARGAHGRPDWPPASRPTAAATSAPSRWHSSTASGLPAACGRRFTPGTS